MWAREIFIKLRSRSRINFDIMETKTRTLVKTVVWRIIATLLTWAVVYIFTGSITGSLEITLVAAAVSMLAYYVHERVWNVIKWGKE